MQIQLILLVTGGFSVGYWLFEIIFQPMTDK